LSDYLSKFIQNNGGEVKLKHIALEIIVENNKAVGVSYKKTRKSETEIFRADAEEIIANNSMPDVAQKIIIILFLFMTIP